MKKAISMKLPVNQDSGASTGWRTFSPLRVIPAVLACLLAAFSSSLTIHAHAEAPRRIVSLAPSITEILFATGLGDRVVGVTTFCDYPEEARGKTRIGGMSNPSLEAVVSLRPDMVLFTTDGNPREFEEKLSRMGIRTYVFESLRIPELPGGIRNMGDALGETERFSALAARIEQRIEGLKKTGKGKQHSVLFIVWPEPLIVAGADTAVNDALNLLGARNIAAGAQGRYPKYSLEEIFHQSPDIIFIGKGEGMREISGGLLKRLSHVPAVKYGKVFYVSDRLFRLSPRAIDGVEELAHYLRGEDAVPDGPGNGE
ncbi:MAG: cobalamin-binding protein [Nitrospiraceae bacterium]|nr:MAG: cobalamin-binding protein [Nitrospiraceae bacterium]